jgi:hypothetical protein
VSDTQAVPDHWGEIDGVSIDFPIEVDQMNSATLTFTVPIGAARAVLPGDAFEVLEVVEGSAMLVLALCDYVQNPWGDYNEVNLGLLVHPVGRPEAAGAFQWRMPVDQEFTRAAGNRVLGLPKTVEDLTVDYQPDRVTFRLVMGGEPALTVSLPRPAPASEPVRETTITYSYIDGVASEVPLTIDLPTGAVDPADVAIELGTGALADELRSMGLPTAPDFAAWGEGLTGSFLRPRPLRPTAP